MSNNTSPSPASATNDTLKVLVIGGTGKTGQETIKAALRRGHIVSAMTRNLEKAPNFQEGNVKWFQGSATDSEALGKAVKGQDSIISALGSDGLGKTTVYSDSARAIIKAMQEHKVRRFLGVTADFNSPSNTWFAKNIFFKFFLNNVRADMERMEKIFSELADKDIDWTIVRPFQLTNGPFTGKYRFGPSDLTPKFKTVVSRSDVADFLLKELVAKQWSRQFVSIGS